MRVTAILAIASLVMSIDAAGQETEVRVEGGAEYATNPFNLRDSWIDGFDGMTGPGERFEGFSSASDVVTTVGASFRSRFRTAGSLRTDVKIGGSYEGFASNSHASFARLEMGVRINPKGPSRFDVDMSWIPERHRKNYRSLDGTFLPGTYSETEFDATYERKLRAGLRAEAGLELARRRYGEGLENRDRGEVGTAVGIEVRVARKTHLTLSGIHLIASTSADLEQGIPVDRSFRANEVRLSFDADRGNSDIRIIIRVRNRRYTSAEPADGGHFERSDTRLTVGADWSKDLGEWLRLGIFGRYKTNDSQRVSDTVSEDVIPYQGLSIGSSLRFEL